MAAINKLPGGLLGFLGIKNGGEYPRDLSTVLLPTWDLSQFYAAYNSEYVTANVGVAAIGANAAFTVPQDQAWLVLEFSASSVTLGAGQTIQLGLQYTDAGAGATTHIESPTNVATVGLRAMVAMERTPLYLNPGSTLGSTCVQLAAGPVTVAFSARVARLAL